MATALQIRRKGKADEKKRKLAWQTAVYDASMQQGELRLAWTSIPVIDPILFTFHETFGIHLKTIRLTGVELTALPDDFCPQLRALQKLSIENNPITCLPENIDLLTFLKELNLPNNKLTHLPARIGFLCSLQAISLNNNQLLSLPPSFGALNGIERLDLECNQLTLLPENLDQMVLCKSINVNHNALRRLPRCIGRMPSLTQFSASCNNIEYIPLDFCTSRSLQYLRLSKNRIANLPEKLGDMVQLQELALDHNTLTKLPMTFYHLTALQILRLDGNQALLSPPEEVLTKGAKEVVAFCQALYVDDKQGRMRHIILSTQMVLQYIHENGVYDSSLFEGNVVLGADGWYALQVRYFFDELIPYFHATHQLHSLSYPFNESEALWAWTNYHDAAGPVLKQEVIQFRKCSCQPICVPPKVGYLCQRRAFCFKKRLLRMRDKEERAWAVYKVKGEEDAVQRAAQDAKEYLASHEGKDWIEETAYEQAEEALLQGGVNTIVQKRIDKNEAAKRQLILSFDQEKAKLQTQRDAKLKVIHEDLKKFKDAAKVTPEGYMRNIIEQRITETTRKLKNLPEQDLLEKLTKQCEEAVEDLDNGLYESSDSESFNSEESSVDSNDSTEEAQRWRRKRDRHYQQKAYNAQLQTLAFQPTREETGRFRVLKGAVAGVKRIIQPHQAVLSQYTAKKWKTIRRTTRNFIEAQHMRYQKLLNKCNGNFDELQKEIKAELARQYAEHQVSLARKKIQEEFNVMERLRESMHGMSKTKTFIAWKRYTWEKVKRMRQEARRQYRLATKGFLAAVESVRSAQIQVEMWVPQEDVYSDTVFYMHRNSGAVTYDQPGLEHYLPPNFSIPPALPESAAALAMAADSSSDSADSLGEWQRKYGGNRNKLDEAIRSKQRKPRPKPSAGAEDGDDEKEKKTSSQQLPTELLRLLPAPLEKGKDVAHASYKTAFVAAVAWAREVMQTEYYADLVAAASAPQQIVAIEPEHNLQEKVQMEWEAAYKEIRRVRNADNPTRQDFYLKAATRKARSHEASMALQRLPTIAGNLEGSSQVHGSSASASNLELPSVVAKSAAESVVHDMLRPTETELLQLAGGDLDMVYTGKPGVELRTVLAQRAMHIKMKLREKAVQGNPRLHGKYKKSFLQREILPFFMWRYEGSSSDSDDEEVRRKEKQERKEQRRQDKELQRKIQGLELAKVEAADPRQAVRPMTKSLQA